MEKAKKISANFEAKQAKVAEIAEKLSKAQSMVIVSYNGITVAEISELRNQFRAAGVDYCVLKNTLVRRALDDRGITGLDDCLNGPCAYAFGMNDAVSPAKIAKDFMTKNKDDGRLSFKAGLLGDKVLSEEDVKKLAAIPSREVLLAQLVGCLQAPIANLVYTLETLRKKQAGEE